ncbi:DUF523 domain-containing protein [Enterococcus sp. BWT-B8]|uniref:DUF523 domain-containing protein n=1 Tax=Enterococcus sp. BWT-B8 TaxID=2885157 RepID=UPI001E4EE0CC|nr:DUF523 domain-containing protein [Enterococcus sp. BWT-B8]MCB5950583.1 DUF523 domain-containing protein [Enterococcus sp. BWT-B8]
MIGISACLGGVSCRYDGNAKPIVELRKLIDSKKAVLVCPEVMGGLSTPREPSEISTGDGRDVWLGNARVITASGIDITEAFKQGAIEAYKKLKEKGVISILMKENSPSCGKLRIYDGSFSGITKNGIGVAAAYFEQKGIKVVPENDWKKFLEEANLHG